MIVRKNGDGSYLLINQTDHALLSGMMSAHWGNRRFARPEPFESVMRAAAFHDAGWRSYEAAPHFDAKLGRPPTFTETPLTAQQLHAYQGAIDWLSGIDSYAGLLIARHRLGLWRQRYGAIQFPKPSSPRPLIPEAEDFIAENERRLERALSGLDRKAFLINYQLLQVLDLLSLTLCISEPTATKIGPVSLGYGGEAAEEVHLTLQPLGANRIRISPYPFDVAPLGVGVLVRQLQAAKISSADDLQREYFGVLPKTMTYELVE